MAGGARTRGAALFGALAATLAATAWVASRSGAPEDFGPVARAALPQREQPQPAAEDAASVADAPEARAPGDAQIDLGRLKREIAPFGQSVQSVDNAFAPHTWYVAPPPPRPAPAPRPVAPPLPFKFMGRYTEGGKEVVFVTNRQDRNYVVSPGDTIEGNYRVESITERSMTLTYLPLGQQQMLQLVE